MKNMTINILAIPLSTPFFMVFSYLILLYLRDDILIFVET